MEPASTDPKKPKSSNSYLRYSGLGLQLFGSIGLSAWIGYRLDLHFGFKFPAFLLTLTMTAFIGAMFLVYKSVNKD